MAIFAIDGATCGLPVGDGHYRVAMTVITGDARSTRGQIDILDVIHMVCRVRCMTDLAGRCRRTTRETLQVSRAVDYRRTVKVGRMGIGSKGHIIGLVATAARN